MCLTTFDAFFPLTIAYAFIGLLWIIFTSNILEYLQNTPKSEWLVTKNAQVNRDEEQRATDNITNLERYKSLEKLQSMEYLN